MGNIRTHNSRTDIRRILKLGGGAVEYVTTDPPCMTTDQDQKIKAQGHKLT